MFLGLDLGTTHVKAILADSTGRVLSRASAPVKIFHVGQEGVEQDIEEIWAAALRAIREAAAGASAVQAIGVSSQGGAMQMMAPGGRPVGRVISWMDGRGRPYDEEITRRLGGHWFAEHVGHGRSGIAIGQLLRLRKERAEVAAPQNRVCFVGDAVVERLCGCGAHDATSLSIALLFNPRLRAADADVLRELGIREDQLPALLSPRTAAGSLRREAAETARLPAGLPVCRSRASRVVVRLWSRQT
jgi:sugar (pentulose or hexulose) kinase